MEPTPKSLMKRKIIIGLVVLAVVALTWYMWKKYKSKAANAGTAPTYTETDISKKMADIKGSPAWYQSIVDKATKNGRTVADQLRLDAIWMLENVDKK